MSKLIVVVACIFFAAAMIEAEAKPSAEAVAQAAEGAVIIIEFR
jgi:hypothetical protein